MTEDESMLRCHGGVRHNNIMHILNNEQTRLGDVDIINQSHYLVEENINMGLNIKKNDFTILSLNCQSISAKFDNLKIFFENLVQFSAVCLQESWLSTVSDTSLYQLEGYNLISVGKVCSAHSGLMIYLKKEYAYKILQIHKQSDLWDGQFIEISGTPLNNKIILGIIYRPPNYIKDNYLKFFDEMRSVLTHLTKLKCEVIIAGDFNIDLLKINDNNYSSDFFHIMATYAFLPKITFPTRFTDHGCTLIDNFFVKLVLQS